MNAPYSGAVAPKCGRGIISVCLICRKNVMTTPAALIFVVCRALSDQGPLDVNGFPVDGVKLDYGTCR